MTHWNIRLLAAITGLCGLIAQVAWSRSFTQVFGASAQAAAIVLAASLAGLAVGALSLGRMADRVSRPDCLAAALVAFAGLAIAVSAMTIAPLDTLMHALADGDSWPSALRALARMLLVGLAVLPATTLLGGVPPSLIRVEFPISRDAAARISQIYGLETLGAAVGGLAAGFWLIEAFGLMGTLWLAAAVSGAAGILAWVIFRRKQPRPIDRPAKRSARAAWPSHVPGGTRLLFAVGLAGFAGLGMEVIWTRLLLLIVGGDTYAYTIVVTSFLTGLGIGALLARLLTPRVARPLRWFVGLQIGVGYSSLALLAVFSELASGVGLGWLASLGEGWPAVLGGRWTLSFGLLLVPTTLLGVSFPVAASHFLRGLDGLGRRTGQLFAASAVGNVTGALAAGFLMIPWLGLQSTVVVLAAASLLAAAGAVAAQRLVHQPVRGRSHIRRGGRWQTALLVAGLMACALWPWLRPIGPLGIDETWRSMTSPIIARGQSRPWPCCVDEMTPTSASGRSMASLSGKAGEASMRSSGCWAICPSCCDPTARTVAF
jgi:spermidine synthase